MKNYLSKDELDNELLVDTLRALSKVLSSKGLDLIIVGASARDIAMKLLGADSSKRKTADLDVAVALKDWTQYEELTVALKENYFKKLTAHQKFAYKGENHDNDYEVDIVPFGQVADDELVKWPPKGCPEMSVRCYDDVMEYAVDVNIDGIPVKIAPLAGQFLIKLDTWIDRNDRETKDAIDMRFIMLQYYMANIMDCEDIPDAVSLEGNDSLLWGAQWIAFETSKMLTTRHLTYYVELLQDELQKEEGSRLLKHLTLGYEESPEDWVAMRKALDEMLKIWNKELRQRDTSK